jgi:hypothetical protein
VLTRLFTPLVSIGPHNAKVRELADLLEHCGGDNAAAACGGGGGAEAGGGGGGAAAVEVAVVREEQMRTGGGGAATEGTAACKNALILGRKVGGRLGSKGVAELVVQ